MLPNVVEFVKNLVTKMSQSGHFVVGGIEETGAPEQPLSEQCKMKHLKKLGLDQAVFLPKKISGDNKKKPYVNSRSNKLLTWDNFQKLEVEG